MIVPCKDCLTIPICKNRSLDEASRKCCLLDDFLEANSTRYRGDGIRLTEIKALQEVYSYITGVSHANTM